MNEHQIVYYCTPCNCQHDDQIFTKMGNCPSCNMPLNARISGLNLERRTQARPKVAILLFEGADVMDVSGPLSVFEHAGFEVMTFAKKKESIHIGSTLKLHPDYTLESLPLVDVLVFPGGGLAESNPGDADLVKFIQEKFDSTKVLFSVCSGAFFLGEAGVLKKQKATTFASMIPMLRENYPEAMVLNDVKYTDNGKVITSAGLSSGIDAAFKVVAKFYGEGRAQDIANHMEYPWQREKEYARSQLADNFLLSVRNLVNLFSVKFYYSQGNQQEWEYRYRLTTQLSLQRMKAILLKELEKRDDWKSQKPGVQEIRGILTHPFLGKALIVIHFTQNNQEEQHLSIRAKRINS